VRDFGAIARNYLQSWCLPDFVGSFPFDVIIAVFVDTTSRRAREGGKEGEGGRSWGNREKETRHMLQARARQVSQYRKKQTASFEVRSKAFLYKEIRNSFLRREEQSRTELFPAPGEQSFFLYREAEGA
jgi:hypothetical protein